MNTISKQIMIAVLFGVGGGTLSLQANAASQDVIQATSQVSGGMSAVSGSVIPDKEATLAAQIPGIVKEIGGRVGETRRKGSTLFRIDTAAIFAKREAMVAAYNAAVSALRNAEIQYNKELASPRTGQPTGMGMPSMMDSFMKPFSGQYAGPHNPWAARRANLQSRVQGIEGARSQIHQVLAQIRGIDAKLNDATIRAPFDGVIISKSIEVGDTVQPGQPLMKFIDTTQLQIKAEVPERLMTNLKVGDTFAVRIDRMKDVGLQVTVNQIYPVANNTLRTVTVKFDLPQAILNKPTHEVLRPGVYAEILIPDSAPVQSNQAIIPRTALVLNGPLPTVYTCSNKKRVTRYVTIGGNTTGNKVTVISGINVGDYIVADPTNSNKATVCAKY